MMVVAELLSGMSGCALRSRSALVAGSRAPQMSELWADPDPARDLFCGPGGNDATSDPKAEYRFIARDVTGGAEAV